jgi:hypothetical protein
MPDIRPEIACFARRSCLHPAGLAYVIPYGLFRQFQTMLPTINNNATPIPA